MIVDTPLSEKQEQAYDILTSPTKAELVYGGGARGGKTWLGSHWIITECKAKPGSGWLIGREELKTCKRTTMRTFFKVLKAYGLIQGRDWKMNFQDMVFTMFNEGAEDSVVFFAELKEVPSDPEFDRLGSYDLTGCWIDEAQEVSKNAKDTLQARFTLLKGKGWVTVAKSLYTCNPGKNWIYSEFWKPLVKEKIKSVKRFFIKALYTDNPDIPHAKYRENILDTGNKVKIERLLHGNFEYDDTPGRLCDYDAICDLFGRELPKGLLYITCDVADMGEDKTIIYIWSGWKIVEIHVFLTNTQPELEAFIENLSNKYLIPRDRIVADAVGIGAGLVQHLSCHGFVGNKSTIQPPEAKRDPQKRLNFKDLNAQCGFMLSQKINKREIAVMRTKHEETIKEELDMIIHMNVGEDKPMKLLPKEDIKKMTGRSPDFKDAMMMRMYFELVDYESAPSKEPEVLDAALLYYNE